MRTETERWRERAGERSEAVQRNAMGQLLKERDWGSETGIDKSERGRQYKTLDFTGFGSVPSVSLFLYLVVVNGQIRTVLCKCKSAGGEIKHF